MDVGRDHRIPPRMRNDVHIGRRDAVIPPYNNKAAPEGAALERRGDRSRYFLGVAAWTSARRFSRSFIWVTRRSSIFLRSELLTMLRLAASRTTLAGRESRRVSRPWSLKLLR